jgi:hypothetical protein
VAPYSKIAARVPIITSSFQVAVEMRVQRFLLFKESSWIKQTTLLLACNGQKLVTWLSLAVIEARDLPWV